MYMYGHGTSAWGYGVMAVSMVVFWGLVVLAGVLLYRRYRRPMPAVTVTADQILDARFARGEIDRDDYSTRRAELRAHPPGR
jgi:putative membrane protein